jgi:HAE1 family hydrophobic/amphiphilic exporter-1
MVVDNSIVVFENIFRHREMGKGRIRAAYEGTTEVWGAVLASTLTTVAVFLPIVFVEEEAGQLFRDIAIAISSAVALSLLISITGIPTLCALILGRVEKKSPEKRKGIFSATRAAGGVVSALAGFVDWMCARVWSRIVVAVVLVATAVVLIVSLIPKTEYLPTGNRELLFGILIPPPGYNTGEFDAIARTVEADILPLVSRNGTSEAAEKLGLPPVKNFFYVAFRQQIFMGVVSGDAPRTAELIPYVYRSLGKVPGMIPIVYQAGLFTRGLGSGRSIDIDLKGPDLSRLIAMGRQIYGMTSAAIPGAQIRPIPGLDLGNPELRITPNRDRLTRLGISTTDLGTTVDALVGGAKAGIYRLYGDEIDLVVKSRENRLKRIQDVAAFPVASPLGGKVLLGSVADVQLTEGPTQINHIDTQRAITIQVNPPADISLEAAMETIDRQVIAPIKARENLGSFYRIDLGGTADQLTRTRDALIWNLVLAVAICYLLMSALFENFLYPLIILFSVPLAAAGGFLGIFLVNRFVAPSRWIFSPCWDSSSWWASWSTMPS